jgi:hypothetical protein
MFGNLRKTWTVKINDKQRVVEVRRINLLGLAWIKVDGFVVDTFGAKALQIYFRRPKRNFEIDEVPCRMDILYGMLQRYNFDLYVNEKFIEPDEHPKIIKIIRETKESYEDIGQ